MWPAAAVVAWTLGAGCGSSRPAQQAAAPAQTAPAVASSSSPAAAGPADRSSDLLAPDLPPLPLAAFPAARPPDVIRAVYLFAARHPEVLSHVPCFCGCERRGHRDNDDCFVAARDAKGRTTAWEPHGLG